MRRAIRWQDGLSYTTQVLWRLGDLREPRHVTTYIAFALAQQVARLGRSPSISIWLSSSASIGTSSDACGGKGTGLGSGM